MLAPLADQLVETCAVLYIDAENRLAGMRHIVGGKDAVDVSIRSVVIDALAFDARSAVIAHNHPSGDHRASRTDLSFTRLLVQGLDAIDVALTDHIILARGGETTSLRATGFL